jgi:hypothetical protein
LEAEAERKKAKEEKKRRKSEKKKRRKEEEGQQKRLEAERGYSVYLKEETRKKKESERKAKPSKTKESVGKPESGVDEEKRKRRKGERRQKGEAAKSEDMSGNDVKETVVGSSEDARRRQLAFSWYSQMSAPDRLEFKREVAALQSLNITPDDVDLLPWNETGSVVDIAKMYSLTKKASLMR